MTTENVFDTGPCLFDHITCTKRYMNNMLELTLMSQDAHNQNKNQPSSNRRLVLTSNSDFFGQRHHKYITKQNHKNFPLDFKSFLNKKVYLDAL